MEIQQLRHLQAAANSQSYAQAAKKWIASRFVVYQGPSPEPPATLARRMLPLLAPWVNRRRDYPVGGLPRRK
ncbi:hypothetical protein, partial [Ellagibacter isourolithinifaciens]|uniref:hypothetical protein n=1 Tax=Ellagibacter isourolithinifaciens TaxID=2137581 RepID=UPI003AB3C0C1